MSFNIQEHTTPDKLEEYSFRWSEIRMAIAAVALFIGGVPPVIAFNPIPAMYSLIQSLLTLCWIISGAAVLYLLYRWNKGGQTLFGEKRRYDTYAFFTMIVTGLNLGITGLFGRNIGMSIMSGRTVFFVAGVIYVVAVYYLHKRWSESGKRLFVSGPAPANVSHP
jgi:uncharacterized membrane protein